jgi:hypothetical protein
MEKEREKDRERDRDTFKEKWSVSLGCKVSR